MKVRKAVIPAAGLGTRFLPATKVLPKEMLNIVDRPAIQYAVEEAARAGISDVLLVTSRGKSLMEDHFDLTPELERALEAKGKTDELKAVRAVSEIATIHAVRQKEPLGLGHAVLMARDHIGDEPFVVLLPDEIVPEPMGEEPSLLGRMLEAFEDKGAPVVAVREVERAEVSAYGIVAPTEDGRDGVVKIGNFIEKPSVEEAPSNLASVGRYVLTSSVLDALETTQPGAGGEIQVTDGIQAVAENQGAYALIYDGPIYDVGRRLDALKAQVRLALRRNDLSEPLLAWLRDLVRDH
jgi:UTP--glucose-1-phosphate uridylyltransferase